MAIISVPIILEMGERKRRQVKFIFPLFSKSKNKGKKQRISLSKYQSDIDLFPLYFF